MLKKEAECGILEGKQWVVLSFGCFVEYDAAVVVVVVVVVEKDLSKVGPCVGFLGLVSGG